MANKPHSQIVSQADGVIETELSSWKWFHDYVTKSFQDFEPFLFRGQRKSTWLLESSLDRTVKKLSIPINPATHLESFQMSVRGRRGLNPQQLNENEWWALGQHYGLDTPLLDWTESPYLGLFFAFEKVREAKSDVRAVYALSRLHVEKKSLEIAENHQTPDRSDVVEIISPLTDDNARLVNQRGLFTRASAGVDLEDWVRHHFSGSNDRVLEKMVIRERGNDREHCLRSLNQMNINHLTLFPDLTGASNYCNMSIRIERY